jgi:hypothetical protein
MTYKLSKEIIKNTDDSHRDYPVLKEALDGIQKVISVINDGARAADSVRKIVDLQSQFIEVLFKVTDQIKAETFFLLIVTCRK